MGRRHSRTGWAMAVIAAAAAATPAARAVSLPSLGGASVQTLIDLGGDGVISGHERYYDFTYVATAGGPPASAVRVQGAGGGDADGLRFVSTWLAAGGTTDRAALVGSTIGFDVAPVDPTFGIGRISLFSNGTAPVAAAGTFVTTTASAVTPAGEPATSILSTFDDGRTVPVDTTAADVDAATAATSLPLASVSMTDSILATAGPTGVASASVVQTLFTAVPARDVPEPAGVVVAAAAVVLCRRRTRPHFSRGK